MLVPPAPLEMGPAAWSPARPPHVVMHVVKALTVVLSSVLGARDPEAHSLFSSQQHNG